MPNLAASPEPPFELALFSSKEAYVYRVPPAGTVGHRAENWNVDKWLAEVSVKILRDADDNASIRLSDPASGELFAECPVALPLHTCVEPVIDSSRYFVLRVVDRETGNHAFIGLGFRERTCASDFNAALIEHQQYLHRKAEAEKMRKEADERKETAKEQDQSVFAQPSSEYALKPGQNIKLGLRIGTSGGNGSLANAVNNRHGRMSKSFSLMFDKATGGTVAVLAPPPGSTSDSARSSSSLSAGSMGQLTPMGLSPTAAADKDEAWGSFETASADNNDDEPMKSMAD